MIPELGEIGLDPLVKGKISNTKVDQGHHQEISLFPPLDALVAGAITAIITRRPFKKLRIY